MKGPDTKTKSPAPRDCQGPGPDREPRCGLRRGGDPTRQNRTVLNLWSRTVARGISVRTCQIKFGRVRGRGRR